MKKHQLILSTILLSQTLFSAEIDKKVVPTSEIPARREFPLNDKVNPCENFDQYVCSVAESKFKLREDRSHHTFAFNDSNERLLESKKIFMKNLPNEKDLSPRGLQIKNYYTSCMDTKSRAKEEREKLNKMKHELEQIKNASTFAQYIIKQVLSGEHNLVGFWASPNVDNPLKLDLQMGANLMDLPDHSYYEKADVMNAYRIVFAQFFKTVDPKIGPVQLKSRVERQIQLQKDYIKTYPVASIRRQRYSEKRTSTQQDLLTKYAALKVDPVFSSVPKDTLVNVAIPEALDFLNSNMTPEKLEAIKDFYLYEAGSAFMDEAYPAYFKAQFDFKKKFFGGAKARPDLQERCTKEAGTMFQMELDQILIDRLFPGFQDEKVRALGSKIRESIVAGLQRNTWLTPEAKKEAVRKIKTATLQLVRPQNDKEWDFLPLQNYTTDKYLENERVHAVASYRKNMEDLKHPANQVAWGMGPLMVNAYYSQSENKFVLPIGILQYPFYDKDGDMLENLGAVGAVVGHELGHSIDDQGSQYDADGKLRDWMTMKDKAEFSKRGQKMIELFNKAGHDGKLTQGENIADLVGFSFAYQAAFPENKGSVEDKKRFFASYARVWCSVSRPDFEKMLLKTDPHAAGWARINEQVKHQPAFAEVFQCKAGDKMFLPEAERVQIW